jgi:hypothetical protein
LGYFPSPRWGAFQATLTKRTTEELTDYLRDIGINVRYLHSEIDALERVEILRALRKGEFDLGASTRCTRADGSCYSPTLFRAAAFNESPK